MENTIVEAIYTMDNGILNARYTNGKRITLMMHSIEEALELSPVQASHFTKMCDEDPIGLAEMIIAGELEGYLQNYADKYTKQEKELQKELEKTYSAQKAKMIAWECMMYDS